MSILYPLVASFLSLGLTLAAMPAVMALLHWLGAWDRPNERSSHHRPVLRGAGLAVLLAGSSTLTLLAFDADAADVWMPLVVALAGFGALGFLDDLRSVRASVRLGAQTCLAFVTAWSLAPFSGWQGFRDPLVLVLSAFVVVASANAFNFMDGINGISAVTAMIAGTTYAVAAVLVERPAVAVLAAVIAGSALGFLPFNFPRPRVFLGDSGSYFWGAALGCAGLGVGADLDLLSGALLAGLPLAIYAADTTTTLARRVAAGHPVCRPHREHTYQLLANNRWGHTRTTLAVASLALVLAALALISFDRPVAFQVLVVVTAAALLLGYLVLPVLQRDGGPVPPLNTTPHPLPVPPATAPSGGMLRRRSNRRPRPTTERLRT